MGQCLQSAEDFKLLIITDVALLSWCQCSSRPERLGNWCKGETDIQIMNCKQSCFSVLLWKQKYTLQQALNLNLVLSPIIGLNHSWLHAYVVMLRSSQSRAVTSLKQRHKMRGAFRSSAKQAGKSGGWCSRLNWPWKLRIQRQRKSFGTRDADKSVFVRDTFHGFQLL